MSKKPSTDTEKDPAAVSLGRRGGLANKGKTSPAKAAAARENGKKGGWPGHFKKGGRPPMKKKGKR